MVTYVGYGLCVKMGNNDQPEPSKLKWFGYAHKLWDAWKVLDDMPPEECATHLLYDYGETLL